MAGKQRRRGADIILATVAGLALDDEVDPAR
jgi:hypothetical protein